MSRSLIDSVGTKHRFTSKSLLPYRLLQGVWIERVLRRVADPLSPLRNRIVFVKNVTNKNVDWSLGAALYYASLCCVCYSFLNTVVVVGDGRMQVPSLPQ